MLRTLGENGVEPNKADFSVLHQNRPPMQLSRRWSMKVRETKKAFDLDLLGRHG
jgi:hypothetical protein